MNDFAIERAGDDMIVRDISTSIADYYRIGDKVSVSQRNGGNWLCGTCQGADRWAEKEKGGCAHIVRVRRWAADHPLTLEEHRGVSAA